MSYTVQLFKNTGFNAVNLPESLSWLRSNFAYTTAPALEILQNEGLTSVRVKTTWDEIKDVDYIVIGDECYSVNGAPVMTSTDVATLPLLEDVVTSEGGAANLDYLDGITERHTVADDTLFKYTDPDPYMAPQEPLTLVVGDMQFDNATNDGTQQTVVESTIDLVALGNQFDTAGNFSGTGLTFIDNEASGQQVTVPYTEGVGQEVTARTNYCIDSAPNAYTRSPSTCLYDVSYSVVQKALGAVRSLGVESSLISQVQYPTGFVTTSIGENGKINVATGKDDVVDSGLAINPYTGIKNNRLASGEYNKYGIISASGDKGEFLPEQIGDASGDFTSPQIRCIADPRPDGKPYFRYNDYLGNTSFTGFFQSAISGLPWKSVPLVYSQASNNYLDRLNFSNGAQEAKSAYTAASTGIDISERFGTEKNALSAVTNAAGATSSFLTGDFSGFAKGLNGLATTAINQLELNATTDMNRTRTNEQYGIARDKELQNYAFSQSVVAPTVLFPFNANIIRDFVGNGVIPYRYKYSDNDVARIDKILTMYGYVDAVQVTGSIFHNRQKFDYVRASGISIGGSIALWKKETIRAQLSAGVRVWHVKPTADAYSDNPIRSAS